MTPCGALANRLQVLTGMNVLQRCQKYLREHRINYSHSIHPPAYTARETASAEQMPTHSMAKTVVYQGDNGPGMLVLPADSVVSFGEVLRLLGLKEVRLATEEELTRLFPGSEVGAMPPFGNLYNVPVLVDEALARDPVILFNAGSHQRTMTITYTDFAKLVQPAVGKFAKTPVVV